MKRASKKMFQLALCTLLILTMVVPLSGCGGGGGEATGGDTGTFVMASYSVASNYDPHKTTSYGDWGIINQLYDTLVVTDFDGQTIKPALAESWVVSDDGMDYTFKLRQDVKFHSGKPMTAEDVKWTFDRWKDPKTASQTGYYLVFVDSVEVVDDYTVTVHMNKPDNNLLINISTPPGSILNSEVVEEAGDTYGTGIVDGTGPFVFDEYIQDDRTILVRNEDYVWGPEIYSNRGPAKLEQLVYRFIPESGTRMMEFQAGNIDFMGNGNVLAAEMAELEKMDFVKYVEYITPYPVVIQFQLDRVPDVNVRKACNMAVDREEMMNTVVGGRAEAMPGCLPESFKWVLPDSDRFYPYDIEAANKLLEDNGYKLADDGYRYKDGKQLTVDIIFCELEEDKMISNLFQSQMKKIGVNVTVNTSMVSSFWSYINTNEFDALVMELFINTPEDMLYEYLSSKNMPYPNRQAFSDPEVDKLLDIARSTTDEVERQESYNRIQEIAMDSALWVPIYSRNGLLTMTDRIKDYKAHPTCVEGLPKALDFYKE